MADKKIELNRRRVLGGMITLGGAAAAAGAGTFALFSDSETSSGNTISAGTLDLTPDTSSITSFNFTEVKPGETKGPYSWTLENVGSINGSLDVNVTVNNDATSNDGSTGTAATTTDVSEDELAKAIEVTVLDYNGDITGQITGSTTGPSSYFGSSNSTSYTSLYNLANNLHGASEDTQNDLINLADPGSGTDFQIGLKLRSEAGTAFQADGLDVALEFILNQNTGQ